MKNRKNKGNVKKKQHLEVGYIEEGAQNPRPLQAFRQQ